MQLSLGIYFKITLIIIIYQKGVLLQVEIIVGLGNPGEKYKGTRHNIGFMITSQLSLKNKINGKFYTKFNSIIGKGNINNKEVLIIQPLTFMNLSGKAVSEVLNWYKIDPAHLIVIFDDINLDFGKIRFRPSGSDGGHNGIKSIIENLGGFKDFLRLKVGIGPDPGGVLRKHYVLQEFAASEKEILEDVINTSVEAIEFYLKEGLEKTRNKFNNANITKSNNIL